MNDGVIESMYINEIDVMYRETIQILHLNDLELDPNYVVGADSECNEPLCCHARNGQVPQYLDDEQRAGVFGHRGCGMPEDAPAMLFNKIRTSLPTEPHVITISGFVGPQRGQLSLRDHTRMIENTLADL